MPDKTQPAAFEETLASLDSLVTRMEDGHMSLEEALSAFETGVRLTRECQQALQEAEQRVQMLSRADGSPVPFPTDKAGSASGE
jgi:exodeoxyribonuclease VII small subunit